MGYLRPREEGQWHSYPKRGISLPTETRWYSMSNMVHRILESKVVLKRMAANDVFQDTRRDSTINSDVFWEILIKVILWAFLPEYISTNWYISTSLTKAFRLFINRFRKLWTHSVIVLALLRAITQVFVMLFLLSRQSNNFSIPFLEMT